MTLKVNEVQLNIAGQGQVTIHWGDGSTETITAVEAVTPYVHTYATLDRYLIELSGPGTVTQLKVQSTPSSKLEEIRSFGDVGLTKFEHEILQANTTNVLEENHLTVVPETIPATLKSLDGLFAHSVNPPVQKTFTWNWTNIESLQSFLYNAKNFEFVWRDQTLPKLDFLSYFAQRAQNGKIYFDNVKTRQTGGMVTMDRFMQGSLDSQLTILRSSLYVFNPFAFISGSNRIDVNLYDVTFPGTDTIVDLFAGTRNAKMTFDKVSFPVATTADRAFKQDGSQYSKSNIPGYGAKLITRNLHMPLVQTANSTFSGWTNAELDLDMSFTSTLDSAIGLFAFTQDSKVTAQFMKFKTNLTTANFIELVYGATDSQFDFKFMEIGANTIFNHSFVNTHRCKIDLSRLKLKAYSGLQQAFMGSSNIELTMGQVDVAEFCNLDGIFSNLSKGAVINADQWVFSGTVRLDRAFSYITEQSNVVALGWTFNGPANISQLCRGIQPYITSYSGEKRGGPSFDLSGWTFNAGVSTSVVGSPSIMSDGILRDADNATINASDWTFNAGAQIALGENVRSMSIRLANWTFNGDADLTSFAENVGVGNLSVMSITLNNWQFNPAATNIADRAFKAFGKRGTTLFGEKENAMIYLNGLSGWTPNAFDSSVNVKQDAGTDVMGLNDYNFQ